jgi:hypothetical protein
VTRWTANLEVRWAARDSARAALRLDAYGENRLAAGARRTAMHRLLLRWMLLIVPVVFLVNIDFHGGNCA